MKTINPRNFKGTRDYLPSEMILRNELINKIKNIFEKYGFAPVETPAIEYLDILLGKYGEDADRLIYHLNYKGGNVAGLKYDLTVPLARLVSQHQNKLIYPFKRYQIQAVWRADRPQPNQGRFREFYQCDADIIGSKSLIADAEIIAMTNEILETLDIGRFVIRINNRKILKGIIEILRLDPEKEQNFFRSLDKLDKLSKEQVKDELIKNNFTNKDIEQIFSILAIENNEIEDNIKGLAKIFRDNETASFGIQEINEILGYLKIMGTKKENIKLDLSLIRGLDYYTGTIYETASLQIPHIGSLSGGGRYDKLISSFTNKDMPALGSTIGLDRIITLLTQLGKIETTHSKTQILITLFDKNSIAYSLKLLKKLRTNNFNTEIILEESKLKKQFNYADKKKIPLVIVCGPDEIKENKLSIKELKTGKQTQIKLDDLIPHLERKVDIIPHS